MTKLPNDLSRIIIRKELLAIMKARALTVWKVKEKVSGFE